MVDSALSVLLFLSFLALTLCLTLRWIVSGTVPMSNGYETMLIVAWFVMLVALITYRKVNIVKMFAFLLSGFFLLVSHIAQMDPQITHVMPVLNSPLLAIHVSIVMMGYALLAFTFVCSLTSLVLYLLHRKSTDVQQQNIKALQNVVDAISFACIGGALLWHFYWSYMGKHILGAVLELGSKRNLGAYYAHGLCCSSAFLLFKESTCPSLLSHLHAFGLLNCADDLLWSELFPWRYA